jgi:hypothetical protein
MSIYTTTTNGCAAYKGTGSALLNLFFTIGSAKEAPKEAFDAACADDMKIATAILMWSRDARQGAGRRSTFRELIKELVVSDKFLASRVISLVPQLGRYDDLGALYDTALENQAVTIWANAITKGDVLAAKWADRSDKKLQKALGVNEAGLRKMLSKLRKSHLVEDKMCRKAWGDIAYDKLPSVAGARYAKAFGRHDQERYAAFITNKDTKVNASVLYPYDVYRMAITADQKDAGQKYWDNLPKVDTGDARIIVMSDVSGSMGSVAAGSVTCMDISISLGVYFAEQLKGHYHNKMISFTDMPTIFKFADSQTVVQKFNTVRQHCGYNTNFQAAYRAILDDALRNRVSPDLMPTHLLVLSDMQFDQCETHEVHSFFSSDKPKARNNTMLANIENDFKHAGYTMPKMIFWNLSALSRGNFPSMKNEKGVAMVSGFSPTIMKVVLKGESFTPMDILMDTLKPYLDMLDNKMDFSSFPKECFASDEDIKSFLAR